MSADDREEEREEIHSIVELVGSFHDRGLHLPTRTIYLGNETIAEGVEMGVNAAMADSFVRNVHVLESLSRDPINVLMNNMGGDVYHGLAIYDAIKCSPCEVRVTVRGHAMSMGSIILQAADQRIMGPTAVQMIHYGTDAVAHHSKTVWKKALEGERLNAWMEQMYLERIREKQPKYTLKKLQKLLDHDTFLTAEQCIELGLADSVG